MKETNMKSSQGDRNIYPRRKSKVSEKHFKCSCGKAYFCNESLYTHRKLKHPDEQIREFMVPEKRSMNIQNLEKDKNVKPVKISNDTFNMLTKSAFLNFFRTMKNLADENKEILRLFLTESNGYTKLNMELFDTGIPAHLEYFLKAYRLHENIPQKNDNKILTNIHSGIHWGKTNHIVSPSLSQQQLHNLFPQLDEQDSNVAIPEMHESVDNFIEIADFNLESQNKITESMNDLNSGNGQHEESNNNEIITANLPDTTPYYYRDFFIIAKEMVKPMTEKFALEMCYVFDKLIQLSTVQQNQKIQEYQLKNQQEILKLIWHNPEAFPKFTSLTQINREIFIEKLLFNLAHLFTTGETEKD